ncbi:MAG TPA: acetyl-CoA carboxylase biotin carboxylase subunit, partial [Candidatus Eremiobacteraceae bacterium]|nr:acetyl-CoA carboxylase biotin carboxylase subunit [Candidatus Eremiobacteraceae bacterium]
MSSRSAAFKRMLVANRGEIALRVIRACRELGIATVAIYSDADRNALHVSAADEAVHVGPTPPSQSYLNVQRILDVAKQTGSDVIHPGYGFLAENAGFARACQAAGVVFVGPSAQAMETMGGKLAARANAQKAGVPVVPGTLEPVSTPAQVRVLAEQFGYPIAIKASAGGGGKGLKIARSAADVDRAMSLAAKEAAAYFADATVYVERYLQSPKHVEIQVLGDKAGNVVHLGERDCSLQRRHQKLVEETPANISHDLRLTMQEDAVRLARAINYDSAGTIECLVEGNEFFFLEMNTRIQVEHTITEATYGFDLVKAQIRVAAGEPLWFGQHDLVARGHAIECRINAESPAAAFTPSPGRITHYVEPGGPGIRIDGAAFAGWQISSEYDSLVAKVVAWGANRDEARRRMLGALAEYQVAGPTTTIPFFRLLLADRAVVRGDYSTSTVGEFAQRNHSAIAAAYEAAPAQTVSPEPANGEPASVTVEVNDKQYRVRIYGLPGAARGVTRRAPAYRSSKGVAHTGPTIAAPMHGIVAEVRVKPGDSVSDGQVVAVIEAMKMMNEVVAPRHGTVVSISVKAGDTVETGAPLI